MKREKKICDGPTLEESIEEVRRRNQQMTPEFVDQFIDVIYRIVVDILQEEEQAKLAQQKT